MHISYVGEDTSGVFFKMMRSIKNGIIGTGSKGKERSQGWKVGEHHAPEDNDMQGHPRPSTEVLGHLGERYPTDERVDYFENDSEQVENRRQYTSLNRDKEVGMHDPKGSKGDYWLDEQFASPSPEPQYGFPSSPPEWSRDDKPPQ